MVIQKVVDYQNVELFYDRNRGCKTRFVFIFLRYRKTRETKQSCVALSIRLLRNICVAGM